MKQKKQTESENSSWDLIGTICFLYLLPAAGVTIGIMVTFWWDGLEWMPFFSKTVTIAAVFMAILSLAIFPAMNRPVELLLFAFKSIGMGSVAMPLMVGTCFGMLADTSEPVPENIILFVKGGMYLAGIINLIGAGAIIEAFIQGAPRTNKVKSPGSRKNIA